MQSPAPVHWTQYVQTFAVIASTIGSFVYLWFTYQIMKWAVHQGKTEIELSRWEMEDVRRKQSVIDSELESALVQQFLEVLEIVSLMQPGTGERPMFARVESIIIKLEGEWAQMLRREISTGSRVGLSRARGTAESVVRMMRMPAVEEPQAIEQRRDNLLQLSMLLAGTVRDLLQSEYGRDVDRAIITKMAGLS